MGSPHESVVPAEGGKPHDVSQECGSPKLAVEAFEFAEIDEETNKRLLRRIDRRLLPVVRF